MFNISAMLSERFLFKQNYFWFDLVNILSICCVCVIIIDILYIYFSDFILFLHFPSKAAVNNSKVMSLLG